MLLQCALPSPWYMMIFACPDTLRELIYELKLSALNKISTVPPCQNAQPIRKFTVYSVYA